MAGPAPIVNPSGTALAHHCHLASPGRTTTPTSFVYFLFASEIPSFFFLRFHTLHSTLTILTVTALLTFYPLAPSFVTSQPSPFPFVVFPLVGCFPLFPFFDFCFPDSLCFGCFLVG